MWCGMMNQFDINFIHCFTDTTSHTDPSRSEVTLKQSTSKCTMTCKGGCAYMYSYWLLYERVRLPD